MKTCPTTLQYLHETDYVIDGHSISFHDIGLIVCAIFGLIAIFLSYYSMQTHASHYLKPWEQKHIIRILFMIPIYALVSFLSYYYYRYAIYWELIRDSYEAFAIASFFTLLCHYIAPNLHDQKDYFRNLTPKNWVWPIPWIQKCTGGVNKGPFRKPKSGLTWFNVVWVGVFQYCIISPSVTLLAVITDAVGLYCVDSLSPEYAHLWVEVINSISVSIAMYCLIQFYIQMRIDLAPHKPFLKILSIKLIIFFSFWQSLLISFLASSSGPLKPTAHIGRPDIIVGIPSMLLCIEMALFAIMHIFAYPYKPYKLGSAAVTKPLHTTYSNDSATPDSPLRYVGGFFGFWAYVDSFNPWDIIKACGRSFVWLFKGRKSRHTDVSYNTVDPDAPTKLSYLDPRGSDDDDDGEKPLPGIPGSGTATPNPKSGFGSNAVYTPAPSYPTTSAYTGAGQHDVSGRIPGGVDGYGVGYENFRSPTRTQAPYGPYTQAPQTGYTNTAYGGANPYGSRAAQYDSDGDVQPPAVQGRHWV